MSYDKTTWVNGITPVNAENMNHIEDGVEAANSIPVLTQSNAVEIFDSKPKVIQYNGLFYTCEEFNQSERYYKYLYVADTVATLNVKNLTMLKLSEQSCEIELNERTFPVGGTKLYLHTVTGLGSFGAWSQFLIISTNPEKITNDSVVSRVSGDNIENIHVIRHGAIDAKVFDVATDTGGPVMASGKTLFMTTVYNGNVTNGSSGSISTIVDTVTPL